jgi:hypothetical protein
MSYIILFGAKETGNNLMQEWTRNNVPECSMNVRLLKSHQQAKPQVVISDKDTWSPKGLDLISELQNTQRALKYLSLHLSSLAYHKWVMLNWPACPRLPHSAARLSVLFTLMSVTPDYLGRIWIQYTMCRVTKHTDPVFSSCGVCDRWCVLYTFQSFYSAYTFLNKSEIKTSNTSH